MWGVITFVLVLHKNTPHNLNLFKGTTYQTAFRLENYRLCNENNYIESCTSFNKHLYMTQRSIYHKQYKIEYRNSTIDALQNMFLVRVYVQNECVVATAYGQKFRKTRINLTREFSQRTCCCAYVLLK